MAKRRKTAHDESEDVGRRDFFGQLLREIARPVVEFREAVRGASLPETDAMDLFAGQVFLRPPSVRDDDLFRATCEGSAECVRACPANAIFLNPDDGYPAIDPANQPCVICNELACMSACPTGALTPRPAEALGMGIAQVDHDLCLREQGVECRLCIESCPLHERGHVVLDLTLDGRVHVYEEVCVGCGCCVRACPTEPRAMAVLPTRLLAGTGE